MKKYLVGLLTILLTMGTVSLSAQPADIEAKHNGLRELKARMETALNKNDVQTLLDNVDEQVVFTTMNGDVVRGKDGVRAYFKKMMEGPDRVVEKVQTKFEVDTLSILHGNDMAIAYGSTQDHYTLTSGSVFDVQARWSATMLYRNGKWIVASFHYSTNMFDNPILDAQRTFMIWIMIIVALLVGVIGFFIGRRLR